MFYRNLDQTVCSLYFNTKHIRVTPQSQSDQPVNAYNF